MFRLAKQLELTSLISQTIIAVTALGIIIGSFVYHPPTLPLGYETAKGIFVTVLLSIISILALPLLIRTWLKLSNKQRVVSIVYFLALAIVLILSTTMAIDPQVALLGNEYRYTGGLFLILSILLVLILWIILNREASALLTGIIFATGIAQALWALKQALGFALSRSELLDDGMYINGGFGQSNFFGGFIVVSFFAGLWLFRNVWKLELRRQYLKYGAVLAIGCGLVLHLVSLGLSLSHGSFLLLAIGLALLLFPAAYLKSKALKFASSGVYLAGGVVLLFAGTKLVVNDFRIQMWEAFWRVWPQQPWFGFGPDNQHLALQRYGELPGFVVDRAHNLPLDLLVTVGIVGTVLIGLPLLYLLIKALWVLWQGRDWGQRLLAVMFVAGVIRSLYHTSSALNILLLSVTAVLLLNSTKQ